jgi:hypothetical protein
MATKKKGDSQQIPLPQEGTVFAIAIERIVKQARIDDVSTRTQSVWLRDYRWGTYPTRIAAMRAFLTALSPDLSRHDDAFIKRHFEQQARSSMPHARILVVKGEAAAPRSPVGRGEPWGDPRLWPSARLGNPVNEQGRASCGRYGSDALDEAEAALGVTLVGGVYGRGMMGCVAPTTDGRVLKVTEDRREVEAIEAILAAGAVEGFAEIDTRPVKLKERAPDDRSSWGNATAWAYLREELEPLGKGATVYGPPSAAPPSPLQVALSKANDAGEYLWLLERRAGMGAPGDPDYLDKANSAWFNANGALKTLAPKILSMLWKLRERNVFLKDMKVDNVGRRKNGDLVLFDAQTVDVAPAIAEAARAEDALYYAPAVLAAYQLPTPAARAAPGGRRENPARSLRDVKCAVCVTMHESWRPDGSMQISVGVHGEDETLAELVALGRPGSAFFVHDAWAEDRWGPFAYDVMMERASEVGLGLVPDWKEVSPDARAVWRYYATKRRDVDKRQSASGLLLPGKRSAPYVPLFPEAHRIYRKASTVLAGLERKGCATYSYGGKSAPIDQRPKL